MKKINSIEETTSLCPDCLKIIKATIFEESGKVWIRKKCEEHGVVEELYFGDYEMWKKFKKFRQEGKGVDNPVIKSKPNCPFTCGICSEHKSHTALANIVVTNRCDLSCWYCFFYAGKAGYVYEPTIEQIRKMLKKLREEKPVATNALQITGGEPSLREDILEIIKAAKQEGFEHVQFNTNGIRIGNDLEFAKELKKAGVGTLYLSFDGVDEKTNPKNHWEIPTILENCRKTEIGIVLVPTIIKSVNEHQVGDILRFGVKNLDIVRGINYQPVSLVGKIAKAERKKFRITIPEVIKYLEKQTNGEIGMNDFYPIPTVAPISHFVESMKGSPQYEFTTHHACGAATYLFIERNKIIPITRFVDVEGLMEYLEEVSKELSEEGKTSRMITLVKLLLNINKFIDKEKQPKGLDLAKIIYNVLRKGNYRALAELHKKTLFIGMMHFQDLYNYDLERVKRCCIHYAVPDGRIIPFCAFNVIPSFYRDEIQEKYSLSIEEWEKKTGKKINNDLYKRKIPRVVEKGVEGVIETPGIMEFREIKKK